MTWTTSVVISAFALVISSLSFALSFYSVWRVRKKETSHAWAEIERTGVRDNFFVLTIKLRNPTQYLLKFAALSVPLSRYPMDERQDFYLMNHFTLQSSQAFIEENLKGPTYLKTDLTGDVPSGEIGSITKYLIRGRLSAAREVKITLCYSSMESASRYKHLTIKGRLPASGIGIALQSV